MLNANLIQKKVSPKPSRNYTGSSLWRLSDRSSLYQIACSLLCRSFHRSLISLSSALIMSEDRSIEALNFPPSLFQRLMRSYSALRRRCLVSILSQSLHFCELGTVCMMSFMPQVSPVRYSLLQCCLKWPHFQSPQAKRCMSKKHMFGTVFSFCFSKA